MFVRQVDDPRPVAATNAEVRRQRRQQLVVRRAGAQQFDGDGADLDAVVRHRGRL